MFPPYNQTYSLGFRAQGLGVYMIFMCTRSVLSKPYTLNSKPYTRNPKPRTPFSTTPSSECGSWLSLKNKINPEHHFPRRAHRSAEAASLRASRLRRKNKGRRLIKRIKNKGTRLIEETKINEEGYRKIQIKDEG
jgi:hypothetical protein